MYEMDIAIGKYVESKTNKKKMPLLQGCGIIQFYYLSMDK